MQDVQTADVNPATLILNAAAQETQVVPVLTIFPVAGQVKFEHELIVQTLQVPPFKLVNCVEQS